MGPVLYVRSCTVRQQDRDELSKNAICNLLESHNNAMYPWLSQATQSLSSRVEAWHVLVICLARRPARETVLIFYGRPSGLDRAGGVVYIDMLNGLVLAYMVLSLSSS